MRVNAHTGDDGAACACTVEIVRGGTTVTSIGVGYDDEVSSQEHSQGMRHLINRWSRPASSVHCSHHIGSLSFWVWLAAAVTGAAQLGPVDCMCVKPPLLPTWLTTLQLCLP